MEFKNGFNAFYKLCLMTCFVLSSHCFSMSLLAYGARCLAVPAKVVGVCALRHPEATVLSLGAAGYVLYNNERTAPYVRPAVNGGVQLLGRGIEEAHRFLYIRPLENALSDLGGRISSLTRRVHDLVSHNNSLHNQVNQHQEQGRFMEENIVHAQHNVQQIAQYTREQAIHIDSTLNRMARAASCIGSAAQSASSLLASLSHCFRGCVDSASFPSLHFGDVTL